MPIEFRCTHCDRLLRTPDGTSGKEAKCPQCGAIVRIPDQRQKPSPPPVPELPPHVDSGNPYQSPAATTMGGGPQGEIHRGFHPTRIDLGDVLSRTWQIFKANLWPLVGVAVLFMVLNGAIDFGMYVAGNSRPETLSELLPHFALGIVRFWLVLGLLTFILKVARGEGPAFSDLFAGGPILLPAIGVEILFWILLSIGFMLFVIPMFVVWMMFSPALLMLIDQKAGVFDAMRLSREATRGNKLTLFALYVIMILAAPFVILLTCGLGVFIVPPFVILLKCVCYLAMTGQSTAEQRFARAR